MLVGDLSFRLPLRPWVDGALALLAAGAMGYQVLAAMDKNVSTPLGNALPPYLGKPAYELIIREAGGRHTKLIARAYPLVSRTQCFGRKGSAGIVEEDGMWRCKHGGALEGANISYARAE